MGLIWTLIIGAIAGFLAGQLVSGRGFGLVVDIIVGIAGSFIGSWLFGMLGIMTAGTLRTLISSVVGAVILLGIVKAIKKV